MTPDPAGPVLRPGPAEPHPALNVLNRLVGTWTVTGPGVAGSIRCTWMDGGYFLVGNVELSVGGRRVAGVEYIGHDPAADQLASHYFDSTGALHRRRYRWDGPTLTIVHDDPRTAYVGTFGANACVHTGRWSWPDGSCDLTLNRSS